MVWLSHKVCYDNLDLQKMIVINEMLALLASQAV